MGFAEEFVEFAEVASPRLRRTAFLLCGDWQMAEDLVQNALAKVFVAWRRIRREDAAHAYATRTLMNCYLADRRRRRPVEVLTDQVPDQAVAAPAPETRLLILKALAGCHKLRLVLREAMGETSSPHGQLDGEHEKKGT